MVEVAAAGVSPALRVIYENPAFREVGGLGALAGERSLSQFAVQLAERLAATRGKACVITASSGVVFQATALPGSSPSRVLIVCDAGRRSAKERELISTVAHEMRNCMSALCGSVEVMAAGASANDSAKQLRALSIARRQLDDMRRYVDDLLAVGQNAKREFETGRAPVRVQDIINDTVESHGSEAERRGIELVAAPVPADAVVMGDAGRLRQVLSNLLLNACKFTPAGGRISLKVERDQQEIRILVEDTGSGIEPDQIASIFQPFGQEHYADDHSGEGLGIGLCVARQFVQLHGGTLTVKSDGRDRGCQFVVSLPVAD
jgi:signal transduction histidine kinase